MTLNDYAREVHAANLKWWLDLERPCENCNKNHKLSIRNERGDIMSCHVCSNKRYLKKERNIGEMLMLAVSELSEALEGHRKNLMDDKLPHRKMVEVELADCVIRLFDTAAGTNINLSLWNRAVGDLNAIGRQFEPQAHFENFGEELLKITRSISENRIEEALIRILSFAATRGMDLEGAYQEKMVYNAKRADHSIAGRLADGGKRY